MLLTQRVSATINNKPEIIWDFASDPKNWTASNSLEHRGLKISSKTGLPETGARFHQQEYVAGVFADLKGHFLYIDRPKVGVWTGIATYRLLGGLLRIRIPEGGTVTLTEIENGWEFAHDVFMDKFPSIFYLCQSDGSAFRDANFQESSEQFICRYACPNTNLRTINVEKMSF